MCPSLRINFLVDCADICDKFPSGCVDCWKQRLVTAGVPFRDYSAIMEQDDASDIEGSRDVIYRKYQDVLNIKSLMVLSKGGVCIYNHPVTGAGADADLIAGFIQANIAFSQEGVREKPAALPTEQPPASNGKPSLEFPPLDRENMLAFNTLNDGITRSSLPEQQARVFELNYQNFVLLVHEGTKVRTVLILDHQPSFSVRNLLVSFSVYFEKVFGDAIDHFLGDISVFEDASLIVEKIFETDLLFPYATKLISPDEENILTSLEKLVYKFGIDKSQKSGFFFIGTIVDELKNMLQKPAKDIIHAIYELVKREHFVPQQIETAAKYLDEIKAANAEKQTSLSPVSAMYGKPEAEEIQALTEELKNSSEKDLKARFKKYMATAAASLDLGIHGDAKRHYELAKVVAQRGGFSKELEQADSKIEQLESAILVLEYNNAMKLAVNADKNKDWLKAVQHYTTCRKNLIDGFKYDVNDKRVKEIERRISNLQVKVR